MNSGESSSANAAVSEQLRQAFQQATYRFRAQPDGGYRGVNRAQRLNLEFTSVQPRLTVNGSMSDSVGFRLTGFGYGAQLQDPGPAELRANETRVEYRRAGITEWYRNDSRGLEQGFTLEQPPAGAAAGVGAYEASKGSSVSR